MIKYTYDNQGHELKLWIDPEDGSLNASVGGNTVKVPEDTGREMIYEVRKKQNEFDEVQRKKKSCWVRFVDFFSIKSYAIETT